MIYFRIFALTRPLRFWAGCFFMILAMPAFGQPTPPAFQDLGGAGFTNWQGLSVNAGEATLKVPGKAVFRLPDGGKGWHRPTDMALEFDGVIDARPWYGIRFEVQLDRATPLLADLAILIPGNQERHDTLDGSKTQITLQGSGWQTVTVPLSTFDYPRGQVKFLKYFKELSILATYPDGVKNGTAKFRNIRLVRAAAIGLDAAIKSRAADEKGVATYDITVTNCTNAPQNVALTTELSGWEGMVTEITPKMLSLAVGETKNARVQVQVPANVPAGAHEIQTIVASPQGNDLSPIKCELTTLQRLPFPYLIHNAAGWQGVRDKVAKYDWAAEQKAEILKAADAWIVPEAYPNNRAPDGTLSVFKSYIEREIMRCTLAWRLTGDTKYTEKIALFLRRLANPENGYPKTLHANSQGIPQEGGFFEGCVLGYEAAVESGVLNPADRELIEQTFRLYIREIKDVMGDGGISNWAVFNLAPAAMCALVVQDLCLFNDIMDGPCGLVDHLRYGTMDDGWWYEMSLSYNLGCAEVYTKLGIAAKPFGIDLLNRKFPVALTQKVGLRPFEFENLQGMAFGKYGPLKQNTITLKEMWDGITLYPDYRGVIFGMGDGHEGTVGGGPFELAYFAWRDPSYASIIKQGAKRDLVYSVPELPLETPKLYTQSGFSDNAGIAVLRSQTAGREPSQQIQAALKYGTHGGYHGHFDRISLLSLMRHGRSFYNPETSWFGYGSYMYKWWVQPTISHNMVVVDGKQQEPQECRQLLFHSGKMMQVITAETNARWSNPPYFGGYDQIEKVKTGNAPFVIIPDNHPKPGDVTDYSEPVRQRRTLIVTDDYVLLADDLRGEKEHTFDNLLHLRGAQLANPDTAKTLERRAQFDTNPLGSGQFITNVDRYQVTAPTLIRSIHRVAGKKRAEDSFGPADGKNWETGGAKSLSEPGELHIDEHILWPQTAEVAIADYAESWDVNKKVTYTVKGDGKNLANGVFGSWILGKTDLDADITGLQTLELQTNVEQGKNTLKTLFWMNPRIVLRDGRTASLLDLAKQQDSHARVTYDNTTIPPQPNLDYQGGPIRISGYLPDKILPAEPLAAATASVVRIDLAGLDAVRFQTSLGGDWPVGNQEQLRKTCSVRIQGREARFLTLLEPYEKQSAIRSAEALSADKLRVTLTNGAVQEITLQTGLNSDQIQVQITETQGNKITRQETTAKP